MRILILPGILHCIFHAALVLSASGQSFTDSNLPIVIIDTDDRVIVDEPKITARMRIVDSPDGSRNRLDTDDFHFDGDIGVELRGQSSLYLFPKKGLGIETRDEAGADLNVSLMGMPEESDWVIHSPYSDKSLIRNALAYLLAGRFMPYAPRVRMAELVINGDYQGVVLFTEKIKRNKNRVDISKLTDDENEGDDLTGGYILRFDKERPEEVGWVSPYDPIPGAEQQTRFLLHYPKYDVISPQQRSYINNWMNAFEHVLMSEGYDDPFTGYVKYIDVSSFINTIIINELARNVDGYRLSTYMYKKKDSNGGKLAMGPTWDHNLSWGNADYCRGSDVTGWALNFNAVCPQDYWVNHVWWNRLMNEDRFRQQLKDQWSHLRRGPLSTEQIFSTLDSLTTLLSESSQRNFQRWPVLGQYVWPNAFVGTSYIEEIEYLKNWIVLRTEWLDNAFKGLTTPVGDEYVEQGYKLFPNPSSGTIFIESKSNLLYLDLYAGDGRLLRRFNLEGNHAVLDLSTFDVNGLLWYRLFTEDGRVASGTLVSVK